MAVRRIAAGLAFALALPVIGATPAMAGESTSDDGDEGDHSLEGTVKKVIDGDSLRVSVDGRLREVRLIGVDAPERPKRCSEPSKEFAEEELDDEDVKLRIDRAHDESDTRLFAYVYEDGELFNLETIRKGYAKVRTYGKYGSNHEFREEFREAQKKAKDDDRGLWDTNCFAWKPATS